MAHRLFESGATYSRACASAATGHNRTQSGRRPAWPGPFMNGSEASRPGKSTGQGTQGAGPCRFGFQAVRLWAIRATRPPPYHLGTCWEENERASTEPLILASRGCAYRVALLAFALLSLRSITRGIDLLPEVQWARSAGPRIRWRGER
jgi:hypothetical protein